jgi:hypothetical protein
LFFDDTLTEEPVVSSAKIVLHARNGGDIWRSLIVRRWRVWRWRLHADPVGMVKHMADLAEVDEERLTLWTFARAAADPRQSWDNLMWMDIARALDN